MRRAAGQLMRAAQRSAEEYWPGLLGLFVFVVALWAQPNALVGVFYDDGIYAVLAKALAQGDGYRYIHMPGAPPGVHYPPLYPAALSALWRLWPAFPQNVVLFQLFDSAALGLAAGVIALHARRWDVPSAAQYVALPLGFVAFPLLTLVGVRFSEPFFLALMAGALLLADRSDVSLRTAVAAGALAGLAVLTRSIGIAVVAGIPLAFWLRGQRRQALVALAVASAMLLPWMLWLMAQGDAIDPRIASTYGTYFQRAGQTGAAGLLGGIDFGTLGPLADLALPAAPPWLWYPLAALLGGAVVWGAVAVAPRVPAFVASIGFYLLLVTVWPFRPDRFVWIVVPWMALLGAAGAVAAWRRGGLFRVGVIILAVAAATGYPRREFVSLVDRRFAATAEGISQPFRVLVPAIAAELPANAVLAGEDEALLYLYTGRLAVPSYLFHAIGGTAEPFPADSAIEFFCKMGVTNLALSGARVPAAPLVGRLFERGDSTVVSLFHVTDGPSMFRFRCPA